MKISSSLIASLALCTAVHATPIIRSDNADDLNLGTAWVGDIAPDASNTATWDEDSTLTNTLGANLTWGGLDVSGASGAVEISGANNLVAGAISLGTTDLSLTTNSANGSLNFSSLAGTGTLTISNGTANLGMTNWNTADSLDFNGTLRLRGGNAATTPGSVGGSFFYLGRTGITQAAGTAFALDTGASASDAKDVILDGGAWNDQTINLSSLTGHGALRCDSGGAGNRTVRVDQSIDTTFQGLVLSHTGANNVDIRSMVFEKHGSGKLTLAGIVGKQAGGAPAADIDITVAEGTLAFTANNTRTGSLTVASGATLEVGDGGSTGTIGGSGPVTNDGEVIFNHDFGSITIANSFTGSGPMTKLGEGTLSFTGDSSSYDGSLLIDDGQVYLGPSLGTAAVTAESFVILSAGTSTAAGTSNIGALTLKDESETDFRIGATNDQIIVNGALTPPGVGEVHYINIDGDPVAGGTITLIDYDGTALTEDEFDRFELGFLPFFGGYELVNNTANTSIDLDIILPDQIWKGFEDNNWDLDTANWEFEDNPGVPELFSFDNPVVFDDTALEFDVVIDEFGVDPLSLTFANQTEDYSFTGGPIFGSTGLVKNGAASVTLAQPNSYTGGSQINAGTLQIGNGGEEGDIGGGAVTIAEDATLAFNLDDTQLRDYKAIVKMRNVSGAGDIVLDGGFTFFNYTGGGTGFNEANSWNNFSGTLAVKGGSEFRTIRNGRTAMGTAQVILGDATTSGHLAQIEGNWTWTNDIQLIGSANEIRNRSTGSDRSMKLQGVISGSGGIVFDNTAGSMTLIQRGFVLTGDNTLDGTITINPGTPVRVGGVPGDTDVNQLGAGIGGTLGAATVINNGTLTFSRSDDHTVANDISGSGAVFVGLSTGNTDQEMTYSGTATHTGGTTVRAGTLTIAPTGSIGGPSVTVADDATLVIDGTSIADTATLNLGASALVDVTGTEVVEALFIDGDQMAAGTWGATGSGADNIDDTRFTGTGVVSVTSGAAPGSDYDDWADGFGLVGGPNDDDDGDGLSNFAEYAFGLDPTSGASVNPITVALDKNAGTFTYTRRDPALTGLTYEIETSTTLEVGDWVTDAGAVQNVIGTVDNVQTVEVTLSGAPLTAPKLFIRVKASE